MELSYLLAFAAATAALALSPGPDNIYVLTESIAKGPRQGIGITVGLISGLPVHTTLVATGLSLVIFQSNLAYDLMKYAGTAYLLYMAWNAYLEKPLDIDVGIKGQAEPLPRLIRRGFLMNVLNPKVTLFFIVLLPQFVSNESWSPMTQMFVLGGVFMAISFAIFSGIALISGYSAGLVKDDRFWVVTKWLKVFVLVGLALWLFFSERS